MYGGGGGGANLSPGEDAWWSHSTPTRAAGRRKGLEDGEGAPYPTSAVGHQQSRSDRDGTGPCTIDHGASFPSTNV